MTARGRRPITGRWALALLVLAVVGLGCSVRDPWQDARIEAEVKARLVEVRSANLSRLGVVSREAVVHLTGTVANPEDKTLAEQVAKGVGGVRKVVNSLEVRPPSS